MLTFGGFLACALATAYTIGFVATPLVARLLQWQQIRFIRRTARGIGRDAVLAAAELQRTTPGLSCATPHPVLREISEAAARNRGRIAWVGPAIFITYLLAGAALSAWLFYL